MLCGTDPCSHHLRTSSGTSSRISLRCLLMMTDPEERGVGDVCVVCLSEYSVVTTTLPANNFVS